jgi:cell division protein FtsZ
MEFDTPFNIEEKVDMADIKVIGVGGGGTNMINHMASKETLPITLIAANTDAQHLNSSAASLKIQIGEKRTKGLGAGAVPDVGKEAALESVEEIAMALQDTDIVFVAAGLGGGTGTGAAPVVASIAKETGALTICVVTKPFKYEGRKRRKLADQGLAELKKCCDSIVVIPNDKLKSAVDKTTGFKDAFKVVDDVLFRAVNGMAGVILEHGESDINVDFADMKTVMSHKGMALMGIGEANGENSPIEALRRAIESPLLDDVDLDGAQGILIHFTFHPNYPYIEIEDAMEVIDDTVDEDADVIFGTTTDESIPLDTVKVILIATGFDRELDEAPVVHKPIKQHHQPVQPQAPVQQQPVVTPQPQPVVQQVSEHELQMQQQRAQQVAQQVQQSQAQQMMPPQEEAMQPAPVEQQQQQAPQQPAPQKDDISSYLRSDSFDENSNDIDYPTILRQKLNLKDKL